MVLCETYVASIDNHSLSNCIIILNTQYSIVIVNMGCCLHSLWLDLTYQ